MKPFSFLVDFPTIFNKVLRKLKLATSLYTKRIQAFIPKIIYLNVDNITTENIYFGNA